MPKLKEMVGSTVSGVVPMFGMKMSQFTLRGIEFGGIWVESQEFINRALDELNLPVSIKTPLLFVPYKEISFLLFLEHAPALSEKAFGATE